MRIDGVYGVDSVSKLRRFCRRCTCKGLKDCPYDSLTPAYNKNGRQPEFLSLPFRRLHGTVDGLIGFVEVSLDCKGQIGFTVFVAFMGFRSFRVHGLCRVSMLVGLPKPPKGSQKWNPLIIP